MRLNLVVELYLGHATRTEEAASVSSWSISPKRTAGSSLESGVGSLGKLAAPTRHVSQTISKKMRINRNINRYYRVENTKDPLRSEGVCERLTANGESQWPFHFVSVWWLTGSIGRKVIQWREIACQFDKNPPGFALLNRVNELAQ